MHLPSRTIGFPSIGRPPEGSASRFLEGTEPMRNHSRGEELHVREKSASTILLPVLLFLLILLPGDLRPQEESISPGSQTGQFTIAVKVGMVVLHASVLDSIKRTFRF